MADKDDEIYGPSSDPRPDRFIANPLDAEESQSQSVSPLIRQRGKKSESFVLLVGVVVLLLLGLAVWAYMRPQSASDSNDLGQAIFNAGGLRAHMVTRLQGVKVVYKLEIEPVDHLGLPGFSYVAARPPVPVFFNLRILDRSGFALCGTQVLLPFNPATAPVPVQNLPRGRGQRAEEERAEAMQANLQSRQAAEAQRQRGHDMLQYQLSEDGKVVALNTQGVLPCSSDQFKRFDYWDFSTNFPTMEEQSDLMTHKAEKAARRAEEARAAARHKDAPRMQSAFYVEGDVRVSAWDPVADLLGTGPGRSFYIGNRGSRATAEAWAANAMLIHYKCDQHGMCVLQKAGKGQVLIGMLNQ
ncbi:MAG TPA: hypothetical protein VMV57_04385 [Terracidiphilus sp.]|nr:hypothetical protein [Terracidiphilus sp.]